MIDVCVQKYDLFWVTNNKRVFKACNVLSPAICVNIPDFF